MSDDLALELDDVLSSLIQQLSPASRRALTRDLAGRLRTRQARRIQQQKNPDGSAYEPRKTRKIATMIGHMRFLWGGRSGEQVREISNWRNTRAGGAAAVTGYDAVAGGFRTFKREDIRRYLSIVLNKRAIRNNLRKGTMFQQLRTARFMRTQSTTDEALVGFDGRAADIARIHQSGLIDDLNHKYAVRYPARELLGFTEDDLVFVRDRIAYHLSKQK